MAQSQLDCLDDSHVQEHLTNAKAEYYYSEDHRAALEALASRGSPAYQELLQDAKADGFLSSLELLQLLASWKRYDTEDGAAGDKGAPNRGAPGQASLAYWPDKSDTEIPPLDLGWPQSGSYRGLNRYLVYTHPPKENAPHIKAVIRQMIQQAQKVFFPENSILPPAVNCMSQLQQAAYRKYFSDTWKPEVIAVAMDLFTDRDVFRDVLDAACRRRVPVYIILDQEGVKLFVEMCQGMDLNSFKLRNLRVRYVSGVGFYMPSGRIPGTLAHKFLMVDGDKVAFGSFRLTWSSLRLDRNLLTYITGQNVEMFDIEFRELYAISEEVNLYTELNIPDSRPSPRPGAGARTQYEGLNYAPTVARKMINPKYALVVGTGLAPGEMMRWGRPPRQPTAQGEQEGEDGSSESQKRLEKFLEDLVTLQQDNSEIPPVEEPTSRSNLKSRFSFKLAPDSKSKKDNGKDGGGLLIPNGAADPRLAKVNRRFSSSIFSRKKKLTPPPRDQLLDGFVVLNKPDAGDLTQSRSTAGSMIFRSSDNAPGNVSPKSTRSFKPKSSEKCVLS